ncbi:hypothetical protein GYMLUDRAFT_162904, partial [Collybiopsis luxurians FD-317 M1]
WVYPIDKPKRTYQFEITKNSFLQNTLVCLPTGAGKTFIASVVMLNYYLWFPHRKIIFLAPTKPLVSQQAKACLESSGINVIDSVELTGEVGQDVRQSYWNQKRVFFMTPQTLLNDISSNRCLSKAVVLVVIDEAHRATGNYAYTQVVNELWKRNAKFRILALSATPGSSSGSIQSLINVLHINQIEIRDEKDLKQFKIQKVRLYILVPVVKKVQFILKISIIALSQYYFRAIAHCWRSPPLFDCIHPYAIQRRASGLEPEQKHLYQNFTVLQMFARLIGHLVEGSFMLFYKTLLKYGQKMRNSICFSEGNSLENNAQYRILINVTNDRLQTGFPSHPKMAMAKKLLLNHFGDERRDNSRDEVLNTKAIVFASNRFIVQEIVEMLQGQQPLIRAAAFVGQSVDSTGKKGMTQREQRQILRMFHEETLNTLVASSIAEEGFDIGEVDLIVCYDSQKSPIRMLQRLGRTGRKRAGIIHILMAAGREENHFSKAQATYQEVQSTLKNLTNIVLHPNDDCLVPEGLLSVCVEQLVNIKTIENQKRKKKIREMEKERKTKVKRIKLEY